MEWIKIKDKLPPNGEYVLVWDRHELVVKMDYYTHPNNNKPFGWSWVKQDVVTHWQPLPLPPQTDKQ